MSSWAQHANERLHEAGYRSGGARAAVIELLAGQDCVVSAQDIFSLLRESSRPVGIASVYRILDLLAELRLVHRIDVGDATARYEAAMPGGEHHHHVVCDDCGRVDPFSDPRLERAIANVAGRVGYQVGSHDVVLRGACGECREG